MSTEGPTSAVQWSPVVELRQYTLHPGQREVLIDLFDREFIEPQEQAGMKVIGQFRDLDDVDRFVWVRGFPNMEERAKGLATFYSGPVWRAHRETANATMVDSSNVLLLKPATPTSAFCRTTVTRPPTPDSADPSGVVLAGIHSVDRPMNGPERELAREAIDHMTRSAGGETLAVFVTESSENTFPALPVRENEQVVVWFATFDDTHATDALASDSGQILRPLAGVTTGRSQVLRLAPTARSLVRGAPPTSSLRRP